MTTLTTSDYVTISIQFLWKVDSILYEIATFTILSLINKSNAILVNTPTNNRDIDRILIHASGVSHLKCVAARVITVATCDIQSGARIVAVNAAAVVWFNLSNVTYVNEDSVVWQNREVCTIQGIYDELFIIIQCACHIQIRNKLFPKAITHPRTSQNWHLGWKSICLS